MKHLLKDFRSFLDHGNVMDMAIGVIIGGAFTGLVKSTTTNLINPLVGFFTGRESNLTNLKLVVTKNLVFTYGEFLNDLINFLITAFIVFLLVKFINHFFIKPHRKAAKPDPQVVLLQQIKDLLEEQSKKAK
ncbi:large conductance mechanosensitive channel protein MscL [Eupransor demetentiae]|uniref:Large-conductance mechanosensitive channel n=1 Tax=Eupransor demetentiae TaxID=3109584 RepID=A0ABP0EN43_9LACO|nr:Large-conductance mechanosensitive channel (MscL) [Lactobacillaceae bacterium LMG 33000]